MASFYAFANRLPDPDFKITERGDNDNTNGIAGPGFATVQFSSQRPVSVSRTNSGRGNYTINCGTKMEYKYYLQSNDTRRI